MKTLSFKTLFLFFSIGVLISCSSDDDSGKTPIGGETQLILTASSTETTPGEEITFEVTADGKAVSGAEIFIDGTGISGYSHVFEAAGEYQAVAKKEGYLDSEALNLNIIKAQPIVYVAGHDKVYPKLWKNDNPINLIGDEAYGSVNSIFVSDDDIYMAGMVAKGSNYTAIYWKNGTPVSLTDGTHHAEAKSIFISEGNVYLVGTKSNGTTRVAAYWKNGTPISMPEKSRIAHSVFVDNGIVHIAGSGIENSFQVAKYWKDGVPVNINNSITGLGSAHDILVSDGDVYLAGWEQGSSGTYVAKYWKNEIPTNLSDDTYNAKATSIFISDGDIYVAGYQENSSGIKVAQYWKNGTPVSLTDGMYNAEANSIFVFEGDVYVCGYETNSSNKQVAKYWKNGDAVGLADGSGHSEAYYITVIKP